MQATPERRTRSKVELSLKFRLRSGQTTGQKPRQLQIRLTVEGETPTDYASGIYVRPDKWDQSDQLVTGRDKLATQTNERLSEIEHQHREILRELKRRYGRGEGPRPTAELVRAEFIDPGSTQPRLLSFFREFLAASEQEVLIKEQDGEATMKQRRKTKEHLEGFIGDERQPLLVDINVGFSKRFHAWLLKDPLTKKHRMNSTSAARYVADLRKCLDYAIEAGYLQHNVLNAYKPSQTDRKEVYFLEEAHLNRLMELQYSDGQMHHTLWWAQLMCLTGLDYKDAVIYARNRTAYEQPSSVGIKIVINRSKPPKNRCEIPLLPQVELLFEEHPTGPHAPCLADLNDWLRVIQAAIEFPKRLSSKICRKTAGYYFLLLGYRIEAVSKILGHSSIKTTEDHYVKVVASFMDSEIERMSRVGKIRPLAAPRQQLLKVV